MKRVNLWKIYHVSLVYLVLVFEVFKLFVQVTLLFFSKLNICWIESLYVQVWEQLFRWSSTFSKQHFFVESQKRKHQNNVWNLLRLTFKIPGRHQWWPSGFFIADIKQISHTVLVFPLLMLNKKMSLRLFLTLVKRITDSCVSCWLLQICQGLFWLCSLLLSTKFCSQQTTCSG